MNSDHTVTITSRQIWTGQFDPSFAVDGELVSDAFEMTYHKEEMCKYECSCGKTFRKRQTVTQHMEEIAEKGEGEEQ